MTPFQQLQYLDHLEGRNAALLAKAQAFKQRRYAPEVPRFILVDQPNVWGPPHPHEDAPPDEWGNVFLASVAAAAAITIFAAANTFVRPW